jgi:hypothetical protein
VRFVLVSTLLLLSSNLAHAGFIDGNELWKSCDRKEGFCNGYIQGVVDASEGRERSYFCLSEKVMSSQARDVVINWLRDNPAERHNPAAWLVTVAMMDAFPCKK